MYRLCFAHTSSSLRLLESVCRCVQMNEPVLLVGETGVGKTAIINYLSEVTGWSRFRLFYCRYFLCMCIQILVLSVFVCLCIFLGVHIFAYISSLLCRVGHLQSKYVVISDVWLHLIFKFAGFYREML